MRNFWLKLRLEFFLWRAVSNYGKAKKNEAILAQKIAFLKGRLPEYKDSPELGALEEFIRQMERIHARSLSDIETMGRNIEVMRGIVGTIC